MKKEEALKLINESDSEDWHVATESDHETFLNNFEETKIAPKISELHNKYDEDIHSVLGVRKNADEKTYDFLKRTLSEMKAERDERIAKIENLEKAVKDTTGKEALEQAQRELESVRNKHNSAISEWESKYQELEGSTHMMKINNELDKGLTGLVFKDAKLVPEDVRNIHINVVKGELAKIAEFVDGKMVFKNDQGEIIRDEKLNPLGPKEILKDRLKAILNEGREQKGPGIDKNEPVIKTKDGKIDVTLVVPDSVKTNADLMTFMLESGLKRGSKEFSAAYAKYSEGLVKV